MGQFRQFCMAECGGLLAKLTTTSQIGRKIKGMSERHGRDTTQVTSNLQVFNKETNRQAPKGAWLFSLLFFLLIAKRCGFSTRYKILKWKAVRVFKRRNFCINIY